jgi:hypothetical protein
MLLVHAVVITSRSSDEIVILEQTRPTPIQIVQVRKGALEESQSPEDTSY